MLTPKENAKRLFNHEDTEYMPIMGEGIINNVPVCGYYERPKGGRGEKTGLAFIGTGRKANLPQCLWNLIY